MASLDSRYRQVGFNLISVQVCTRGRKKRLYGKWLETNFSPSKLIDTKRPWCITFSPIIKLHATSSLKNEALCFVWGSHVYSIQTRSIILAVASSIGDKIK